MRIFACMASSLDGKIGPANTDRFVSITSRHDMEHLKDLRDESDGILFGAGTFRTWPKVHHGQNQSKKQHHFIMSSSLDLDINTPLFKNSNIPLTIFTPSKRSGNPFPAHVELIRTPVGDEQIAFIVEHIKAQGYKSLLIEGGGQVLHQFIEAQLLQELFLTVTPKIIGQVEAPGLLGNQPLSIQPTLKVLDSKLVGDEIYLHLSLIYE